MLRIDSSKADALYSLAIDIRDRPGPGCWINKVRHLALRGYPDAMIEYAAWLCEGGTLKDAGRTLDNYSASGLYYRAYRSGAARAAQHLSMKCFNQGDLAGYRQWLRRAARLGDGACGLEIQRFETRLPHGAAGDIRRKRPHHRRDQ